MNFYFLTINFYGKKRVSQMESNVISSENNQALEENFITNDLKDAIFKTIVYSDLFSYPLKLKEVHKYLDSIKCSYKTIIIALDNLVTSGKIAKTKKYYHLPSRESLVRIREQRVIFSKYLWRRTLFYSSILKYLPFIKMISITGALALNNAKENDDIDLFIITNKNRLWIARIFVVIVMKFGFLRKDHLCPNYLISEENMKISTENMYTAREIINMIPVYSKDDYFKFIKYNSWIKNYFPNFKPITTNFQLKKSKIFSMVKKIAEMALKNPIFSLLDIFEMKRTSEKLSKMSTNEAENIFLRNCCKSHLEGHGNRIMKSYAMKINDYI
jgi:hypothetical protein